MFALLRRSVHLKNISHVKAAFSSKSIIDVNDIKHPTKVPLKPVVSLDAIPTEKVNIDEKTIELLMRLSLVNITDQ